MFVGQFFTVTDENMNEFQHNYVQKMQNEHQMAREDIGSYLAVEEDSIQEFILPGNAKDVFENRVTDVEFQCIAHALVNSQLTDLHAVEVPYNLLGESEQEDDRDGTSYALTALLQVGPYFLVD